MATSTLQSYGHKGIFCISDTCSHQGNHLHKPVSDTDTTFNMIHDLNWPRRHHTKISAWQTWNKSIRTLCDEIKVNLCTPLGQWTLDNNEYITYWQWFLSCDPHTLYYREHGIWWTYTWPLNLARRCIAFQTDTKLGSWSPYHSQVCRIILTSSSLTHLQIEATGLDFPLEPYGPPLE